LNIYFLLCVILCSMPTEIATGKLNSKAFARAQNSPGPQITLTADNEVTKILALRDGGADNVPFTKNRQWWLANTLSLQAYPNMTGIQISGMNWGIYTETNPAAILATVTYRCNGKLETISTGSKWECRHGNDDWAPAKCLASNKGPSIWYKRSGNHPVGHLPLNAQWIWTQDVDSNTSDCRIIFPCKEISPVKVRVTVDNKITKVLALREGGSDNVSLAGLPNLDNWMKPTNLSLLDFPHSTGIQISGMNSGAYQDGNPDAILATVTYKCNGELRTINTGSKWQCRHGNDDWAPAKVYAQNRGPSIWFSAEGHEEEGIPGNAEWIWVKDDSVSPVDCRIFFPC